MDLERPAVKLCAEGIQLEFAGRLEEARRCFAGAWEQAADDYEKCIAAHYVGHLAQTADDQLFWHKTALAHAQKAEPNQVETFMPSLYVNLGHAYEQTGDAAQATHYYDLAAALGLVHQGDST